MEKKLKEITIENAHMLTFTGEIKKNTRNSDIFLFLRRIQDDAIKNGIKINILGSLYWFLIEHRDKLKVS